MQCAPESFFGKLREDSTPLSGQEHTSSENVFFQNFCRHHTYHTFCRADVAPMDVCGPIRNPGCTNFRLVTVYKVLI